MSVARDAGREGQAGYGYGPSAKMDPPSLPAVHGRLPANATPPPPPMKPPTLFAKPITRESPCGAPKRDRGRSKPASASAADSASCRLPALIITSAMAAERAASAACAPGMRASRAPCAVASSSSSKAVTVAWAPLRVASKNPGNDRCAEDTGSSEWGHDPDESGRRAAHPCLASSACERLAGAAAAAEGERARPAAAVTWELRGEH